MKPELSNLTATAAYYEGYADGMTAVVERWSKSLGLADAVFPARVPFHDPNLGAQLAADHDRHRTLASDLKEDR